MIGVCNCIIFTIDKSVFVSSSFAFLNFFSSYSSLFSARITLTPVRFSLVNKLILSIIFWNNTNFGITSPIITIEKTKSTTIANPIIHVISGATTNACITAPTAINGARINIDKHITIVCCTCETSLVVLVTSEAVENCSVSEIEKDNTLANKSFFISRLIAALTFAEKYEAINVPSADTTVTPNILIPICQM